MTSTAPGPGTPARFAPHFVESVLLTWMGNVARIVIGLVALRLVTGAVAEADLGAYWVLTSLAALLANFADLGLGLGAVRHLPLAADASAAKRLMHTVLVLRFGVLLLLCLLIYMGRPWILRLFDADVIAEKYAYLYAFVAVNSLCEIYTNFLQGLNRFRAIAVFAFVSSLSRLVLIVVFVRSLDMHVEGLFLAEVGSMVLAGLLSAAACGHGLRFRFETARAREQLRFGFPLYLNLLLSYTANRINTVLIGSMTGTTQVSWFSVASRVPDQLSFVQRAFNFVFLPNMTQLLARDDPQSARRLLAASLRLMSFCFALLALGLSFVRHELLAVLAPPAYQVAAPAVPLLLGGLAFSALGGILGNTLLALGDSRTPVLINFWTSLFNFALNLFCIQRWGFLGAAWANFVFNVVAYAVTDIVVSRRIRPEGRGYLVILLFLGGLLVAGLDAGWWLRAGACVLGAGGSFILSPALRRDAGLVWNARAGRRGAGRGPDTPPAA